METISSKNNNLIKKIRSLSVKKYREQFGLYKIEGEKVCNEAISRQSKLVEYIFIKDSKRNNFIDLIKNYDKKVFIVFDEIFDLMTETQTSQSILIVMKLLQYDFKNIKLTKFIVLDHLQDPGNMGTIIRSGIACGFCDFVLIDSVDPYDAKTLRSTSGNIWNARIIKSSYIEFSNYVNDNKINLIVADMGGKSIFDTDLMLPKNFGLVIGNEGNGVSKEIAKLKNIPVSIPMDKRVESLNAGVSASILMFILNNK